MKPSLIFLPFLGLILGAICAAIGSTFKEVAFFSYVGLGFVVGFSVLWIILDSENFRRLLHRKGTRYGASSGIIVIFGLAIIVLLAMITNRPRFNKTLDLTKQNLNTLTQQSEKIIDNLKTKNQSVDIKVFYKNDSVRDNIKNTLELFQKSGAPFNVEYINTESDPKRVMAESLTSENVVIFKLAKQEARITTFNEEKITNALVKIMKDKTKKIFFTKGHGEGGIHNAEENGLQNAVDQLEKNNYQVADINLMEVSDLPAEANLLVIAAPKYDFNNAEIKVIDAFLKRGGTLLTMVNALTPVSELNGLLANYGIKYNNDLVIFRPGDRLAQIWGDSAIVSKFDDFNPITKDFARQSATAIILPIARTLSEVSNNPNQVKVSLIGKSVDSQVRLNNIKTADDLKTVQQNQVEPGSFDIIAVASGKIKRPALAANMPPESEKNVASDTQSKDLDQSKEKDVRIVALGSELMSNAQMAKNEAHQDMMQNIVNFLLQDEDFISLRPKENVVSQLTITSSTSQFTLLFISWVFPFIFLISSGWFWLRRRSA